MPARTAHFECAASTIPPLGLRGIFWHNHEPFPSCHGSQEASGFPRAVNSNPRVVMGPPEKADGKQTW